MEALSLYELNNLVRRRLEEAFPDEYWVQAELSDVRSNATGHCYLELIEKDARGNNLIAKARAMIWSQTYRLLRPYFEQETGQAFVSGIKVTYDESDVYTALYCYGRACRDAYEKGEGEDFVGRFKAESLEAFEKLTLAKPDFDMGYYFLGYGYLNLGLYMKAKLTWEEFMKLSGNGEMKSEIARWLEKLSEPVKIEEGYNKVISGRFQEGIDILSPYREDPRFNNWWPLWYYLGLAYDELGDDETAKECLLKVLTLSPSNTEVMEALAAIYEAEGDEDKAEKYRHKVKVVKENREAEKVERNPGLS